MSVLAFINFQSNILSQLNTPDWAYNATIYEVNVRQFTKEGTFKSFQQHLIRLKELGVDIIWLMPINPIGELNRKGTLGSYYSVKDYKDINPEFGTKEDFRELVNEIHKLGMCVIVDWVANHTSWDNVWVREHPDFYTKDKNGNFVPPVNDWADVIDLNYDNKDLWYAMSEALQYWVKEFKIDGYRCDVAGMVPTEFWNFVRPELEKIKPVFMLAEWESPELHKKAFEMSYSWDVHRMMNDIYKGKKRASNLKSLVNRDLKKFPPYAFRMQFTSNHDENTWNGTEFERLGDAAEMFAVLTYILPGMPLIYNGQESGFNKRLEFFEKDQIEWKPSKFENLYKKLNEFRKSNNALWSGIKAGTTDFIKTNSTDVLAILRTDKSNKVFAIFNMSAKSKTVEIKSKKLLGVFTDFNDKTELKTSMKIKIDLAPWSYRVLHQINN